KDWAGKPSIFVLDCSAAGVLLPHFEEPTTPVPPQDEDGDEEDGDERDGGGEINGGTFTGSGGRGRPLKDVIVMAACGEDEVLPTNADLPADVFTCCLTTPMPMALRWFIRQNK
ncbi:unnamed protein product, partial [Ectocarpus sp. 12 AP-2014]